MVSFTLGESFAQDCINTGIRESVIAVLLFLNYYKIKGDSFKKKIPDVLQGFYDPTIYLLTERYGVYLAPFNLTNRSGI